MADERLRRFHRSVVKDLQQADLSACILRACARVYYARACVHRDEHLKHAVRAACDKIPRVGARDHRTEPQLVQLLARLERLLRPHNRTNRRTQRRRREPRRRVEVAVVPPATVTCARATSKRQTLWSDVTAKICAESGENTSGPRHGAAQLISHNLLSESVCTGAHCTH